jgi:shikimate kinase
MGAGKSTVGRALAERLGYAFRDMDAIVEERAGQSVAEIFRDHGEPAFRKRELEVAEELRPLEGVVIAAGGGAFAQPRTHVALREGSTTVWLQCDLEAVMKRVAGDASRPLAADRERMQALLDQREAAYRLADLIIDTTDAPPAEVAARIVKALFPGGESQGDTKR